MSGVWQGRIAVAEGASIWTILTTGGALGSFFALLTVMIRQRVPMRNIKVQADERFRDELAERVRALEDKIERKDETHALEMERERATHAAEIKLLRHRLNNVTQCLDALLMLIKANPDKAGDAVSAIENMRAKQLVAEAQESGAVSAAKIKSAKGAGE